MNTSSNATLALALAIAALGLLGCEARHDTTAPAIDIAPSLDVEDVEYDVGFVDQDFEFDCDTGKVGKKVVKAIQTTCSCTAVDLKSGDHIDLANKIRVSTSLHGKTFGSRSERFLIRFTDNSSFSAKISYAFWPQPSSAPRLIVFRRPHEVVQAMIFYPGEPTTAIESIKTPPFISCMSPARTVNADGSLSLEFAVNDVDAEGAREGYIDIQSTSQRQQLMRFPFVIMVQPQPGNLTTFR